ncbi:MAG TPA: hypothetical protein VK388_17080 [Pyrinomonadaceae bacterium]|nr:hypothetical protein [Pyrinomonadaceae bacterium]
MKDLIDIIADTLRERDAKEREDILLLVENLYFNDVRKFKWIKSFFASNLTLIAQDIINLQNGIDKFNSIKDVRLRSEFIKAKVDKISKDGMCAGIKTLPEVDNEQRKFFVLQVIKPNRSYVTAAMLAELIRDEKRRTRTNQALTYLIPILTALITAAAVILTKQWSKV